MADGDGNGRERLPDQVSAVACFRFTFGAHQGHAQLLAVCFLHAFQTGLEGGGLAHFGVIDTAVGVAGGVVRLAAERIAHEDVTNAGRFQVAVQDLATRQTTILTDSARDESPSFAPNGRMILYATDSGGRGVLSAVSTDGRIRQRLTVQAADVREPSWGPQIR